MALACFDDEAFGAATESESNRMPIDKQHL